MNERSSTVELWLERKQRFTKETLPYLQYMAQSGFPAFLGLIGIVVILQYIKLIQNTPETFPFVWVGALLFTPVLCYSPLRTYFKEADIIYLMPMEAKMSTYIKRASQSSLYKGLFLVLIVLLVFWPLYRQSSGFIGLWIIPILLVLKVLNSVFAWQERKLVWASQRNIMRLLRWLLMFLIMFSWLQMSSITISFVLLFCTIAILAISTRTLAKHTLPWKRLIDEENQTIRRMFSFFNWFIDVQVMPPTVKKRNYLSWLITFVDYRQASTFAYLNMITFVRTEIGGMCVRILLLGGLVNYMVAEQAGMDGWGVVISYIFFAMLLSMQIGTLRKTHQHAIWKDIFPLSIGLQQKQVIKVDLILSYVLLFILVLPTYPIWLESGLSVFTILIFYVLYPILRASRLKRVLSKEQED